MFLFSTITDNFACYIYSVLNERSNACRHQTQPPPCDPSQDRWQWLLNDEDDTRVWRAVNWQAEMVQKGEHTARQGDQA